MRSTLGGFFIASGHAGLDDSHGSKSSRLPPGVRTINVECPSQVIESFCIYEFTNLRIDLSGSAIEKTARFHRQRRRTNFNKTSAPFELPKKNDRHSRCTYMRHESPSRSAQEADVQVWTASSLFLSRATQDVGRRRIRRSTVSVWDARRGELPVGMSRSFPR